ncbi:MAG: hypothetical protein AB7I19_13905 [Planctomycetota bacterium]
MSKSNFFTNLLQFLRRWQNTLFLFSLGLLLALLPFAYLMHLEAVVVA